MNDFHSWGQGRRAPRSVLLVGCGKLGTQLGRRLLDDGAEVFALRRTPAALPAGFTGIADDLRVPRPRDLPGCDSVVITLPPDGDDRGDGGIYASALENLAAALDAEASRVLFVSSTRVLEGLAGSTPLTEADAAAPLGERARELVAGEARAADLLRASIIRPAGIYGPGRDSLIRRVRDGVPVDYSRRTNRIHEDDLVSLLHDMLWAENPPSLIHAVDQAPVPLGEVVTFIANRLGVKPPPRAVPEVGDGTVLDGRLLRDFLGALRFPTFREGYERMLADAG